MVRNPKRRKDKSEKRSRGYKNIAAVLKHAQHFNNNVIFFFLNISFILFKAGRASCHISSLLWHKSSSAEFKMIKLQTHDIIHKTRMRTDLVSCSDSLMFYLF